MRGVSRRAAPLLAVFLVFTATGAWADEPPTPPTDPPEARLRPPDGVTSQARANPPVGIAPPPPTDPADARVQPPVGAPDRRSLFDLFLTWLQARLSIPPG